MKGWKRFLSGAGMLAALGIVAKIIGVFYRLPLTNILGAEGMGLYQMIFPLYSLLLAASSGGLPSAISKYVSELRAEGNHAASTSALKLSIIVLSIVSGVIALLVFFFGGTIARLQGNPKAGFAYSAIAPAIVVSGIIACMRGYFQGYQNMLPSGISQTIEQLVKAVVGLYLATVFATWGIEYGVFGALIGITLSEVAALIYLVAAYYIPRKRRRKESAEFAADVAVNSANAAANKTHADVAINSANTAANSAREAANKIHADANKTHDAMVRPKKILRELYSVALPVTIGSLVMPLSQAIDSFLVINLLVRAGSTTAQATSLFGLIGGPVGSLINMPPVITVALAASLLPKAAFKLRSGEDVISEFGKSMSAYMVFMLPCVAVFAILPYPVLDFLYSGGLSGEELSIAASLLRIESVNLIFIGFIHLATAMLQAAGKAKVPVVALFIGAAIKTAAMVILLPHFGIYGAAISNLVCYGAAFLIDLVMLKRQFKGLSVFNGTLKAGVCAICFAAILTLYYVIYPFVGGKLALVLVGGAATIAYTLIIVKTKSILLSEMLS